MSDLEVVDFDEEIGKLEICPGNETDTKDIIVIEEISLEQESDETKYKKYLLVKNDMNEMKSIDLREKVKVTRNILDGCRSEKDTLFDFCNSSMVDKLKYYTKLPEYYLESGFSKVKTDRSFLKAIQDTKPLPNNVLHFVYNDVREIFVYFFIEIKKLPTTEEFLKKFNNFQNITFCKYMTIRGLVKNGLVDFHYFPGINRYILAENPRLGSKRTLYLKQMKKHRSGNREIAYVTIKKIYIKYDRTYSYLVIAASPITGLISRCDAVGIDGDHQIRQWIQSDLLRQIAPNTVVVLTQPPMKSNVTPFSVREEMMDWLEQRDIPFEKNDHKATLYNLVKIHKNIYKNRGLYEDMFRSFGLEVVLCPNEYETLDFFGEVYKNMRTPVLQTTQLFEKSFRAIEMLSSMDWMDMEMKIAEEETKMMIEDIEMEKVVENILLMVKNGKVTQIDFPDVFATKEDNFDVHIGDIIVD